MDKKRIATYKVIKNADGNRYKFYCDLSGALVCITGVYKADTPEAEVMIAWEQEAKQLFNSCNKCGKFVDDIVFNPEVSECVDCAPYEAEPKYCKNCGTRVDNPGRFCPACGKPLNYEGRIIRYDTEG